MYMEFWDRKNYRDGKRISDLQKLEEVGVKEGMDKQSTEDFKSKKYSI